MINNKKIKYGLVSCILLVLTSFQVSFAQVNATWYTQSLNVSVGDTVKIDLYINPREDHPVVTVSSSLNYDPDNLKFVDAVFPPNWLTVTNYPNFETDEKSGFIRRTGGVPNGINTSTKYITYIFEAKAEGDAELSIEDGIVLDQESSNLGIQKKKMTIHVSPKKEIPPEVVEDEKNEVVPLVLAQPEPPKVVTVSMDIYGKNAIHTGDDYVAYAIKEIGTSGIVSVSVNGPAGNDLFVQEKQFYSTEKGNGVEVKIPGSVFLDEGDYIITMRTRYTETFDEIYTEKKIGVLSSDRDWIDRNRNEIFSVFAIIILLAAIYHIHYDHKVFRRLRARAHKK